MQPVGDMLARNSQCGAIFHQADIVDVRHFGTTHALIDPTYDVTQDALGVVVKLSLYFLDRQVLARQQGDTQNLIDTGRCSRGKLALFAGHTHSVIMNRMQGGRRRRGHPRGIGARFGVADFDFEHLGHLVRFRPHALTYLRNAAKARRQSTIDVGVFVGENPRLSLDDLFLQHRTRLHAGVNFIPRSIEKTRVDEHDSLARFKDAGPQVHRRASFFVHHPDFQGVARQSQYVLHTAKQLSGQGDFFRSVHLRLDDIDTAGSRILHYAVALQIVHRRGGSEEGIEKPFRYLVTGFIEHRIGRHQVTDVTYQHQAAAR